MVFTGSRLIVFSFILSGYSQLTSHRWLFIVCMYTRLPLHQATVPDSLGWHQGGWMHRHPLHFIVEFVVSCVTDRKATRRLTPLRSSGNKQNIWGYYSR